MRGRSTAKVSDIMAGAAILQQLRVAEDPALCALYADLQKQLALHQGNERTALIHALVFDVQARYQVLFGTPRSCFIFHEKPLPAVGLMRELLERYQLTELLYFAQRAARASKKEFVACQKIIRCIAHFPDSPRQALIAAFCPERFAEEVGLSLNETEQALFFHSKADPQFLALLDRQQLQILQMTYVLLDEIERSSHRSNPVYILALENICEKIYAMIQKPHRWAMGEHPLTLAITEGLPDSASESIKRSIVNIINCAGKTQGCVATLEDSYDSSPFSVQREITIAVIGSPKMQKGRLDPTVMDEVVPFHQPHDEDSPHAGPTVIRTQLKQTDFEIDGAAMRRTFSDETDETEYRA